MVRKGFALALVSGALLLSACNTVGGRRQGCLVGRQGREQYGRKVQVRLLRLDAWASLPPGAAPFACRAGY